MKKFAKYINLALYILTFIILIISLALDSMGKSSLIVAGIGINVFFIWLLTFIPLKFLAQPKEAEDEKKQHTECKFCENPSKFRHYLVPERNQMDTDNLCEILTQRLGDEVSLGNEIWCNECYGCVEDNTHFKLNAFDNCISLSYQFKGRDLQIHRNSEVMHINFCPWCGKQLSEKMVVFEKCVPCSIDAPVLLKE